MATIGSLFLFSNAPQLESQSASIVEIVVPPSPTPSKTVTPKAKPAPTPIPTSPPTLTIAPPSIPSLIPTVIPASTITPVSVPMATPSPTPSPTPKQSGKININTADRQKLEEITGVGPTIAQRIIDYRQTNGPFQKIEELKNVKGIGDKTFEKMKDEITI